MSRSAECLSKIKKEIGDNSATYSGKSPSEIAIEISKPKSKNPPEFITVHQEYSMSYLVSLLKTKGVLKDSDDPADVQVEVFETVAEKLSLGEVTQGDVEQAIL